MQHVERRSGRNVLALAGVTASLFTGTALAQAGSLFAGQDVPIGQGKAHTIVRTDAQGKVLSYGVVFTPGALDGLPSAAKGKDPDFPYLLPMPETGPKTLVDHVVINWESAGHAPAHVYDVPHFDFHFYLTSADDQNKITFKSDQESGDPAQQPGAELMPSGYILPPGTAVSRMGVHAVNPTGPEFNGQPFTATFIYGYYDKKLTFVEPMASLAFFKSKPSFSAEVVRPSSYSVKGEYPSRYSVKYDPDQQVYEVTLDDLK